MSRPRARWMCIVFIAVSLINLQSPAAPARQRNNKEAAPAISADVLKAEDVNAHKAAIDHYVSFYAQKLINGQEPAEQSEARNKLCAPVENKPSTAFLEHYSRAIDKHIIPAAKHSNQRTRLNAVMVLARVASISKSPSLEPSIREFLGDKGDAVALWAMKAAGAILPEIVGTGAGAKFLTAIEDAATQHHLTGMADEVYETLSLHLSINRGNVKPTMIQAVIPLMQKILDHRIGLYVDSDPESPSSEKKAIAFLGDLEVLVAMNETQRMHTLQELIDLMSLAAQHAGTVTGQERKQFIEIIQRCAGGIHVVGMNNKDDALIKLVKDQERVGINTPQNALVAQTQSIINAILAIPQYSKLNPPQVIKGAQPATAPATAPPAEGE